MKIAIIVANLPEKDKKTGGVSIAAHRLANELSRMPGNAVTVFSFSRCPDDAIYQYVNLFPKFKKFRRRLWFVLYLLPFLLNFVDFSEFDVLHLHGDDWFYFLRKLPSVRTLHGSALDEAKTATSLKRKLLQYSVYPLEQLSARLASLTIAVGKESQAIYKTDRLIGNGVDVGLFTPRCKTEFPSLCFIGTWAGRKRGEFLHQVFTEKILPIVPEAMLYVIADEWPEHPNVTPISFPSDAELAKILSQAWVFAYPSSYEGFGIPYIEALSSGTAVITTDNMGAQFVLNQGEYGVISSDQEFSDNILQVLTNDLTRQMFETKGVERGAEFSWSEISRQHLEAYQTAISGF
jgi:phosphatidyl-myo-inositol alpha-mannosyltransferase